LAAANRQLTELQALQDPDAVDRMKEADELVSRYDLSEQRIEALILAERELSTRKQELADALQRLQTLMEQNAQLQEKAVVADALNSIAKETGADTDALLALLKEATRITTNADELRKIVEEVLKLRAQVRELSERLAEAGKTIESIAQEKGIDPPCWYDEQATAGKTKERPIFLFDVAVFDTHLMIRDRPTPERYLEERARLPLQQIRFMQPLSDREFREVTEPIKKMGKEKQVRSYSCVFYVLVWDQTSTGAKERWKHATETVIGGPFYRATANGTAW
jgi:multidrug efflux pump subunit AcrA (membrane-fusion protein)